ncbi:cobyric acid synthase, partial [Nitrosarchaeum koreense]|nr:cobyric acid synthase [Nitrosarchaeum koreense]
MKSLMIQGTASGVGKTTLVAALCRIFSDKGYNVAPFKSQNMSNFGYATPNFEISRAQVIQAIAARCKIESDLNPIMLKPLGNYYSTVYLNGKRYKKMHAKDYYSNFVNTKGFKAATDSLFRLQNNYDLVILEGAGSPAEINLQKYDIANMRIAQKANASVLLVSDIDKGGSFASLAGTMALIEKKYQKLIKGFVLNKFRGDIDVLKPGFRKI